MSYQRERGEREDKAPPGPPRDIPTAPVDARRVAGSPSIVAVAGALRKARKQFGRVVKDKENPFTRSNYADLAAVLEAVDEALEAAGLLVLQSTRWESGELWLDTTVCHDESGEWLASVWPLLSSNYRDPQRNGSALTYGRRYAVLMMLGIAAQDDDGHAGGGRPPAQREREQAPPRREERPRAQAPPVDERRRVREEVDAAAERPSWSRWVGETLRLANGEWLREMTAAGVPAPIRGERKELANEPRVVNHLVSRLVAAGIVEAATVTTTNREGKTVRDPRASREQVVALFDSQPGRVKASVERYLEAKREELRAELGIGDGAGFGFEGGEGGEVATVGAPAAGAGADDYPDEYGGRHDGE